MLNLLYPPFLGGRAAVGLLILRLVAGSALFLHGLQKMARGPFGWMGPDGWAPPILQFLAAFSECLGGLALIVGLLTPLAALGIGATMAVAVFLVHVARGDPYVRLSGGPDAAPLLDLPAALVLAGGRGGSYELAAMFLATAIILFLAGPGTLSLDAKLFRRKPASVLRPHAAPQPPVRAHPDAVARPPASDAGLFRPKRDTPQPRR